MFKYLLIVLILLGFVPRYAMEYVDSTLSYLCIARLRKNRGKYQVLYRQGATKMLTIQMMKQHNAMINEDIIVPRLVNTQTIEFKDW